MQWCCVLPGEAQIYRYVALKADMRQFPERSEMKNFSPMSTLVERLLSLGQDEISQER